MVPPAARHETPHAAPLAISGSALVIDRAAPLGAGASGEVMRATLNALPVAAKTCAATQRAEEQFSREVRRLHACRHPNIINVYGVASLCDNPRRPADLALVTELCSGGSLQDAIERLRRHQLRWRKSRSRPRPDDSRTAESNSSLSRDSACDDKVSESQPEPRAVPVFDVETSGAFLPTDTLVRVAGGVASALAYLHASGLSQGDVKPMNILLTQPLLPDGSLPQGAAAKVCDFGLSRRLEAQNRDSLVKTPPSSAPGTVPPLSPTPKSTTEARPLRARKSNGERGMQGTVPYLAPEAFSGIPADASALACAADIYALGICLYELVTLRSAWPHQSDWGVFNAVVKRGERPPWPTEPRAAEIAAPWRELVELCWHHDPALRPTARFVALEIVRIGKELAFWVEGNSSLSTLERTASHSSGSIVGEIAGDVELLNVDFSRNTSRSDDDNSASNQELGQSSSDEEGSTSSACSFATSASKRTTVSEEKKKSSETSFRMDDSVDELFDGLDLKRVTSRRLSSFLGSVASGARCAAVVQPGVSPLVDYEQSTTVGRGEKDLLDENGESSGDDYLTESVFLSSQKVKRRGEAPASQIDAHPLDKLSHSRTLALHETVSKSLEDANDQLRARIASIVGKWNIIAARRPVKKKRVPLPDSVPEFIIETPACEQVRLATSHPSSAACMHQEVSPIEGRSSTNGRDNGVYGVPPSGSLYAKAPVTSHLQSDKDSEVCTEAPSNSSHTCALMTEEELDNELAHFVSSDSLLTY